MIETVQVLLRCSGCSYKKHVAVTKPEGQRLAEGVQRMFYCYFCQGWQSWGLAQAVKIPDTTPNPAAERKQVLIVDDDEQTVELLKKVFGAWHVQVEVANNGEDALTKIAAGNYDVMVCAVQLQEMTGLKLFQYLRDTAFLAPEHILFLAEDRSPSVKQSLESSGCSYLYKPLQFAGLCDQIETMVADEVADEPCREGQLPREPFAATCVATQLAGPAGLSSPKF